MIVLDTHVLVWLADGSARLGKRARRQIERASSRGEVCVSAITFWEIAWLLAAGRLRGPRKPEELRLATLRSGVAEVPVDGEIAILSTRIAALHADPADRIIVATALVRGAALVTADEKLLALEGGPHLVDAEK